jgi:hypothetical protein
MTAAAGAAASVALPASASTTIDFQDVAGGSCAWSGSTVSSRGFTFGGNPADPHLFVCNPGVVAQNTTQGLINANLTSILTFAPTGGGTFSLNSFFAGARTKDWNTNQESTIYGTATGLDIVGQLSSGGTVSAQIAFDGLAFEQFFLPSSFTNLTSVTMTALGAPRRNGPEFLIDDIVVNGTFNAAVPEPSTWAMMVVGFGLLGGAMRASRRRRALSALLA